MRVFAQEFESTGKRKIITIIIAIVIIIALLVVGILYCVNKNIREWIDVNVLRKEIMQDSVATINYNTESNAEICAFDKYIGVLSKNTLQIYNSFGKEEAKLDIPSNNVLFNSSNRFLSIAEKDGKKVYLISGTNLLWENEVEGNILQTCVNRNGYVAVVVSNTSYKTVVNLFDNNGKELFKIYLSNTRVADISISNDNRYLALAEIDTSSSLIQSKVKIVSIENAQKNTDESIVYINNAESNKLLTNISYNDKNRLICMYDNSIEVIYDEEKNEILNFSERKARFISIDLNNTIALVEEKSSGLFTADSDVEFINITNQKISNYTVEEAAKEIYTSGENLALNVGAEVHFINAGGWLVKRYIARQEISNVVMSESIAGIVYRDKIEIINL